MNNNTQNTIINGILSGNHAIIKAFYEKHLPQVKSFILKNSGNESDAEDVFQDAMVFIYEKLESDSLQLTSSLGTYVYSVSKYIWMNKLKRSQKIIHHDGILSFSTSEDADIVTELHTKEKEYVYEKAFLKLGAGCQELLSLFFRGLPMKKIAEQKGCSEAYARKKKYECKNKLEEIIQKDPVFKELKANDK